MHTPILELGATLVVSIRADVTDDEFDELRGAIAERVGSHGVHGLVIDVAAMDVMDSFATRMLLHIAKVARLRGAAVVIVGIQPDVAFAMVQLGLSLEGVGTALDLDEGIAYIAAARKQGRGG